MAWIPDDFGGIDKLFTEIMRLTSAGIPMACRGQADIDKPLRTSLDRILDADMDYASRLAEEAAILAKFMVLAPQFLGDIERRYLERAFLGNDRICALGVLQHYGAPTRLLDWTHSPWVALYFAALHHHDKDGALWWFDQGESAFEHEVDQRWKTHGMRRYPEPKGPVNLNDTAFESDGPAWIAKEHYYLPFLRMESQQGFFTVAGRLGYDHDDLIDEVLNEHKHRIIAVPKELKGQILNRLRSMNIHAKSLDYPGADYVGQDLTRELRSRFGRDS